MKIPNSVIYVVGDVLGNWYYSHSKLNTLFGGNGFPGDPPPGNCIEKCQEWLRRANETPDVDPIELLGYILTAFMNAPQHDDSAWRQEFQRITEVLAKNGLTIDSNGHIAPLPARNFAEEIIVPCASRSISEITVFISYSHDSDFHRDRVLGLSERLRADGVATILDRYVESGSPSEGWPRWMMNGLNSATHVLCVCTDTYSRRFRGQEVPGAGKGADWEGALITNALYASRSNTTKFVPVLFDRADEPQIPAPLRGQSHYLLDSEAGYQALYDALLDQSGIAPGAIGEPKRKPRATGQPLTFGDAAGANPPTSAGALRIWHEKLDFLLIEDAVCVDPAMKFRLKHLISEAREKIHSFGGGGDSE